MISEDDIRLARAPTLHNAEVGSLRGALWMLFGAVGRAGTVGRAGHLSSRCTPYTIRYIMMGTSAAAILKRARRAAGLSQAQLAELAGTSQSAVAAYERGAREPTLPVLDRMVSATGHRLGLSLEADPQLFRLTDLSAQIRATSDDRRRLRLAFEFLRGANEDGYPLVLLVAAEPPPTGDARFDALLAAIAEDLCIHTGVAPPGWVLEHHRFLQGFWWVSNLPSVRARAFVHAPASYRRRGVLLARDELSAA